MKLNLTSTSSLEVAKLHRVEGKLFLIHKDTDSWSCDVVASDCMHCYLQGTSCVDYNCGEVFKVLDLAILDNKNKLELLSMIKEQATFDEQLKLKEYE